MHYFTDKPLPPWMNIENCSVPLPLPQYVYLGKVKMLKKKTKNPIVRNMITIWYQVKKYLGESSSCHASAQYGVIIFSLQAEQTLVLGGGPKKV